MRAYLAWMGMAALLALPVRALETSCTNALDDDADFLVDCDDGDCRLDAACLQSVNVDLSQFPFPLYTSSTRPNQALVSWPEIPAIPDVGGIAFPADRRYCAGDAGFPATGDGGIDSTDVLCMLWGRGDPARRVGAIQIEWFESTETGTLSHGHVVYTSFGRTEFLGNPFRITGRESYRITSSLDPAADNGAVLAGACDPSWSGDLIAMPAGRTWTLKWLPVRYGGLVDHADEVLCGIEGVDWNDLDADGKPDTCTGGLFDGSTCLSVLLYDYKTTSSNETDGSRVGRTVMLTDRGIAFVGTDFAIEDGDGVEVQLYEGQQPRMWRNPPGGRCP